MSCSIWWLIGPMPKASTTPQAPIATSQPTYQRSGRLAQANSLPERERAQREPAKKTRDNREHGGRFMSKPERALLRPHNLTAQARKARRGHGQCREPRPPAAPARARGRDCWSHVPLNR